MDTRREKKSQLHVRGRDWDWLRRRENTTNMIKRNDARVRIIIIGIGKERDEDWIDFEDSIPWILPFQFYSRRSPSLFLIQTAAVGLFFFLLPFLYWFLFFHFFPFSFFPFRWIAWLFTFSLSLSFGSIVYEFKGEEVMVNCPFLFYLLTYLSLYPSSSS